MTDDFVEIANSTVLMKCDFEQPIRATIDELLLLLSARGYLGPADLERLPHVPTAQAQHKHGLIGSSPQLARRHA